MGSKAEKYVLGHVLLCRYLCVSTHEHEHLYTYAIECAFLEIDRHLRCRSRGSRCEKIHTQNMAMAIIEKTSEKLTRMCVCIRVCICAFVRIKIVEK